MAAGAMIAVGAVVVAGIASAADLGPGHIAASEVPVLVLAPLLLAPGIIVLVVLNRMPRHELRST